MASQLKLTELLYPTSTTPAITINADDTVTFGAPTTTITNLSTTSITDSGNLTFTGTGNRITGDFSNATVANRVAFQTSTVNGGTTILAIPNGTGTSSQVLLRSSSAAADDSFGQAAIVSGSDFRIVSGQIGTGTYLPMTFSTGGSEAMRIDTSRNVGIGVTPSAWGSSFKAVQVNLGIVSAFSNNNVNFGYNNYYDGSNSRYIATNFSSSYQQESGAHKWFNAPSGTAGNVISFTQAMTLLANGAFLLGATATGYQNNNSFMWDAPGFYTVTNHSGTAGGTGYALFGYNGTGIGSITQNGTTGVLYNLTSDYRLKNDPQPLTGSKDFIMALQPKKWQWWDGSGEGVGFIAHEFMEVAKYSGNGEKDAVDADGKPVYQSIQPSSSEVMANLIALIQQQQALIQDLTTRLNTLEGN